MPSERTAPVTARYAARWLSAEQAAPLLGWPVQRQTGETMIVSPLTPGQRQQALDVIGAGAPVRRQVHQAVELRLTPHRGGYFVALGPLSEGP